MYHHMHTGEKHLLRCVITWPSPYMLTHILQLPKKDVADLCLCQLATMYVQMHLHKIFSPRMIYTIDSYTL